MNNAEIALELTKIILDNNNYIDFNFKTLENTNDVLGLYSLIYKHVDELISKDMPF